MTQVQCNYWNGGCKLDHHSPDFVECHQGTGVFFTGSNIRSRCTEFLDPPQVPESRGERKYLLKTEIDRRVQLLENLVTSLREMITNEAQNELIYQEKLNEVTKLIETVSKRQQGKIKAGEDVHILLPESSDCVLCKSENDNVKLYVIVDFDTWGKTGIPVITAFSYLCPHCRGRLR